MSTEAATSDALAYSLDDQVGHLLRRAYQSACANLAARIGEHDLTPMQMATLARLWEYGEVSQNRLGRLVAMEPANIHGLVGRLAKRGLVASRPDPSDRRRLLLRLTMAGRRLFETIIPLFHASTAATLAPLDAKEAALLRDLLRRIAEHH